PERSKWINDGSRTDGRMTGETDVSDKTATVADAHMRTDSAVRADRYIVPDLGPGLDPSRGIDQASTHASERVAPTSASAPICPATFASPRNHHMDLRRVIRFMWYSIVSPGRTGLRNLALSIVRKKTDVGCVPVAATQSTPAVCAIPSIINTPGNTGLPGKCPWKCGSLNVTFLMPIPCSSPRISITRSTIKNG